MKKLILLMMLFSIFVGCTKYTSDTDFVGKNIKIISANSNISRDYLIKSGWLFMQYDCEFYEHYTYEYSRYYKQTDTSFSHLTVTKNNDTTYVELYYNYKDTYRYINGVTDTTTYVER